MLENGHCTTHIHAQGDVNDSLRQANKRRKIGEGADDADVDDDDEDEGGDQPNDETKEAKAIRLKKERAAKKKDAEMKRLEREHKKQQEKDASRKRKLDAGADPEELKREEWRAANLGADLLRALQVVRMQQLAHTECATVMHQRPVAHDKSAGNLADWTS